MIGDAPQDGYAAVRMLLSLGGPSGLAVGAAAVSGALARCPASAWEALADEAEHHGVAPVVEAMLAAVPADMLPGGCGSAPRALAVLASRHRRATLAREVCIDRLLEAFGVAGIPLLLLKGAALAHCLYPRPELRPMADVDVLIHPDDARAAAAVLRAQGYRFATGHGSRITVGHHHLPPATLSEAGFQISVELHTDTMSRDQPDRLGLASLTEAPLPVRRPSGHDGATLGHIDMLRHLTRHAFEPARRIRLIHLLDVWRYQARYGDEIDWCRIGSRFPHVTVASQLIRQVFEPGPHPIAGAGMGMVPLTEIAASTNGLGARLSALLDPSPWWLHGFYGVPPEHSLLACRTLRHPATLGRWLGRRLLARSGGRTVLEVQ